MNTIARFFKPFYPAEVTNPRLVHFASQGMAEGMLGDGKLEVADVAAATLSGLLKASSPVAAAASRTRYLDAAGAGASERRRAKQLGAARAGKALSQSGNAMSSGYGRACCGCHSRPLLL